MSRSWGAAVDQWTRLVHQQRAQATAETYAKHVRSLAAAMSDAELWDVTPARLDAWIRSQSWSTSTRSKVLVSIRAFYVWAMDEGLAATSPVAGVAVSHTRPGPLPAVPRSEAWAQASTDYLTHLRAGGRAEGTMKLRRWQLHDLSELHVDPWAITSNDLALWVAKPDLSGEYRRSLRGTARSFYGWAVKTDRCSHNPALQLDPVLINRALPRPISRDALVEALSKADDRQRLILLLAALAGLRRAEVAGVHFRDVLADSQLLVRGKGGHQRLVPLHPVLLEELKAERRRRATFRGPHLSPDGYLFPSCNQPGPGPITPRRVADLAMGCLPPGWTLHTLRHRFATQAYSAQRDLRAVQELLGHAKPETTARYAAVPDGAKLSAVLGAGL